ncbi:hypothetical protein BRD56_05090 [Thermoplasmatales archaeon SW_10_69_26]|nr:MAG: hypothetical protein BRD56_05090 [Thermoplasmatales archaeon SW_10_69_26]
MLAMGFAGCIGSDELSEASTEQDEPVPIWHEQALAFGPSHDHTDPTDHANLSTPNFDVLGYDQLNSSYYGQPAGSYFCGDAKPVDDDRRLAVFESRSQVGFTIADVTDPTDIENLGELVMQTTRIYDLAVVPDGEHVVLVTSEAREDQLDVVPGTDERRHEGIAWNSPCTDEPVNPVWSAGEQDETDDPVPRPMSLLVVDISDPEEPVIEEQQPLAGSGHSVYTRNIDGTNWAMVTTTRVPVMGVPELSENSFSAYQFYRIEDLADRGHAEHVATWKRLPDDDGAQLGPRGHDGRMKIHPKTDEKIAYLAGGDRFTTLDMSNPENPEELGRWEVEGSATPAEEGTLHSAYPLEELWNGTHYTVIGPEHAGHPEGAPTGVIWVMDTTDPTEPEPVGAWTLPAQVNWNGTFQFSNHYLTVVDETLFVSMYHGGVWAVDLSPLADGPPEEDGVLALDSEGVFLPDRDGPAEPAEPGRWAPTFEEVLGQPDGTLVGSAGDQGLVTFAYDDEAPMPAPEPWDLSEAIEPDVIER